MRPHRFVWPLALLGCAPPASSPTADAPPAAPLVSVPTASQPAAATSTTTAEPAAGPPADPVFAKPLRPINGWRVPARPGAYLTVESPPPRPEQWKRARAAVIWGLEEARCKAARTDEWLLIRCPYGPGDAQDPYIHAAGNGAWQVDWDHVTTDFLVPIAPGLHTSLGMMTGEGIALELRWRDGSSVPASLGTANEAPPPDCGGMILGIDHVHLSQLQDCRRAGHTECEGLLECLAGSPQRRPLCPDGWEFQGKCVLPCAARRDCWSGWSCGDGPAGTPVCLEPE